MIAMAKEAFEKSKDKNLGLDFLSENEKIPLNQFIDKEFQIDKFN